jgi:hypothetical protein
MSRNPRTYLLNSPQPFRPTVPYMTPSPKTCPWSARQRRWQLNAHSSSWTMFPATTPAATHTSFDPPPNMNSSNGPPGLDCEAHYFNLELGRSSLLPGDYDISAVSPWQCERSSPPPPPCLLPSTPDASSPPRACPRGRRIAGSLTIASSACPIAPPLLTIFWKAFSGFCYTGSLRAAPRSFSTIPAISVCRRADLRSVRSGREIAVARAHC